MGPIIETFLNCKYFDNGKCTHPERVWPDGTPLILMSPLLLVPDECIVKDRFEVKLVEKLESFESFLRNTLDLPYDAKTTITVDCPNGYRWEGNLEELREVLLAAEQKDPIKIYKYCPWCGVKL